VGSADGTGVWLKTPQGLAGDTGDLEPTFKLEAGWGRPKDQEIGQKPQSLAGNAGDLEPTFQLEAGWGRRMEQESG
jgi:hypothetical protein